MEKIRSGGEIVSAVEKSIEMCLELGKTLAQTDEYKKMKEMEHHLLHDQEARKLVENLQIAQAEHQKKLAAGLKPTEEDTKKLRECEELALGNPTVKAAHYANSKFHELMNLISSKIREGIRSSENDK